jgi:hypothetical protein
MKKRDLSWLIVILLMLFTACKKDELDFNKRSKRIEVEREIALPLVKGNISFGDLLNIEPDSLEIINLLDTLKLYYNLEFDHQDTIKLSEFDNKITIDFVKLYYWFTNEFPLGLDAKIYLYDSKSAEIIDTILFSHNPSEAFLPAAPVDINGIVIKDMVKEKSDVINISKSQAENLLKRATNLILFTHIQANTLSIVKVSSTSYLRFKLSIDAKGKYEGYQDSGN